MAGAPTQGGRPKAELKEYLDALDDGALDGVRAAAFDTRFALSDHGLPLRLLMRIIGFAAQKISNALETAGAEIITEPMGFIVTDKKGPLRDGELERAKQWMRRLLNAEDV